MTSADERQAHWQHVWATKAADKLSWFQQDPHMSLALIDGLPLRHDSGIIDVGGGRSGLAGCLLERGFIHVAVLDIAEAALVQAHQDLGAAGDDITWICSDVAQWRPVPGLFEVWHDRAAFHFLTSAAEQQSYVRVMRTALVPGGWAIIAGFAPDGPHSCSGQDVQRHDGASLSALFGRDFTLEREIAEDHHTPGGATQKFQWCLFRRL